MTTIQERLQIKRVPLDRWSTKEKLCLASAVLRSGDQNWSSVSRALKQFAEPNRPPDWFSQKNCAAQYGLLLENVETPKRKKRISGSLDSGQLETPGESIVRKLKDERRQELLKLLDEEKSEYVHLLTDMDRLRNGTVTEAELDEMEKEIEEEQKQKELDAIAHSDWLKAREEKKLELERVFRPVTKQPPVLQKPSTLPISGQKRKASESTENILLNVESNEENLQIPDTPKPALSPLLTSLLKTPSNLSNISSSILHSAITSQRVTSPTIASLLSSTTNVPVSPSLQQLVTTAISKEPTNIKSTENNYEDTTLPIESIHKDIIKDEKPKKEEEVQTQEKQQENEEIKTLLKVNEDTIVRIKEENSNSIEIEKNETENSEVDEKVSIKTEDEVKTEEDDNSSVTEEKVPDVYDFDESSNRTDTEENTKDTIVETSTESEPEIKESADETDKEETVEVQKPEVEKKPKEKEIQPGSVEIVEVVVMEDDDSDKEIGKKIDDVRCDLIHDKTKEKNIIHSTIEEQIYTKKEEEDSNESKELGLAEVKIEKIEEKPDININIDEPETTQKSAFTPEYSEAFFDMAIEVTKNDKPGKAKRDYSRMKKKEEKDIDILLAVEKEVNANLEENEAIEETGSEVDSQDSDKKSDSSHNKPKIKDQERSNSPWTEEEEVSSTFVKAKRRYSTPATPIDSVPNSPASSIVGFEEDRDYKTWKKSVMLVYSRLAAHKYASLFLKPITDEQAPGYHSIIYRPMDLQTIRKNVENGTIRTTAEFQRDVMLMFTNAVMYNKSNNHVYNMAKQMQQEGLQQIQILQQAQTQIETPVRRETRTSESGFKRKRATDEFAIRKKRRDE